MKKVLKSALPDQLHKANYAKSKRQMTDPSSWSESLLSGWSGNIEGSTLAGWKRALLVIGVIVVFFSLFLRMFHLQVAQGYKNRQLADSNRIQIKPIHAPRGVIYDRVGLILAQNEPGFRLTQSSASGHTAYISRDEALKMEISRDPRLTELEVDSLRSYPLAEKTAHLLGYVGEITAEELKSPDYKNYKAGDKVGRSGIEQTYEKLLKGKDGGEIIEVDSAGKKIRTLGITPPIPGSNIYLTIDGDLQVKTYEALKKGIDLAKACCGAAVAEDPKSGQILSLVSLPSFDPQNLEPALTDPHSPLLNRAIAGTYPPGSTFKIVSALAGLTSKKITPDTVYEDTGVINLGPYSFANWYFSEYGRKEQGPVNLVKALQRSNDIYFYQLGDKIGVDAISQTAKSLSFGQSLGIDLPGEANGIIADNNWKKQNLGEVWYPGDTLHTAIGQGFTLVTPLQISNLISFVAADGKEYPPHLVSKITSPENHTLKDYHYDPTIPKNINPDDLKVVKTGLELVPKMGGTAWPFFNFGIPTAGKTGTAEFGDPKNRTHAWYTSFAPVQDPKISLTVLVEAGGEGSTVSGAIEKEIYSWYFSQPAFAALNKNLPKNLELNQIATQAARTLGE